MEDKITISQKKAITKLVQAHKNIKDDPMTCAIWIKKGQTEVWIVEVMPTLEDEKEPVEAYHFTPGKFFNYPLALIAGNFQSISNTILYDKDLAKEISEGEIIWQDPLKKDADKLIKKSKAIAGTKCRKGYNGGV